MKKFLPILSLLLAFTCQAADKKLSQEPRASTVEPLDDITINAWTGASYVTRKVSWTNFFQADAFVFGGDSFMGEIGLGAGVGYGTEMPTFLLSTTNYSRYAYTYNFGVGGYTTANVSNGYPTTFGLVKPPTGQTAYAFLQTGNNNEAAMTNMWTNCMMRLAADGYTRVAFTAFTNAGSLLTVFQTLWRNTNNLFIRANTNFYEYLVDYDLLTTNVAVQLMANGHPTPTHNQNIANWISANIPPLHSKGYRNLMPPRTAMFDLLTVKSNALFLSSVAIVGPTIYTYGPGLYPGFDTAGVQANVIVSDGLASFRPTLWQSSAFTLNQGPLIVSGSSSFISNAATPSIHFGTTNSPAFVTANGSIYLSSQGTLYLRTNGTWIIK